MTDVLDAARRLATPPVVQVAECLFCAYCGVCVCTCPDCPEHRPHASDCPWLAIPQIVAALESAALLVTDGDVGYLTEWGDHAVDGAALERLATALAQS
jgi:hypothetical protein